MSTAVHTVLHHAALYNEWEPYAAQWIRNLVEAGHVAPGVVDERSIKEIQPDELGSGQVHLFAGIAIWSHALRMAGYPDSFPVWSASFPCQPFSAAGRGDGVEDPRHLWPDGFRLIKARRPVLIVGEQVASPDGLAWLDLVFSDLEGAGYACRAVDICAAGFGAPHIRQRLYWAAIRLGDAGRQGLAQQLSKRGALREASQPAAREAVERTGPGATDGFWADVEWLPCRDGKRRPTQPGLSPLAHGAPSRVGRLRAYGNGLNTGQAIGFLEALKPSVARLWGAA